MAKLSHVAPEVPVSNLREALEFYQEMLGFKTVMVMPEGDYAVVERDDVAIHLFQGFKPAGTQVGMHFFTSQLDELHSELLARGAQLSQEIELKPWGNRDFRLMDPSGNVIKFTERLLDGE